MRPYSLFQRKGGFHSIVTFDHAYCLLQGEERKGEQNYFLMRRSFQAKTTYVGQIRLD